MTFDATKPNTGQTIGDVIVSTLANLIAIYSELGAHEGNSANAHGIDTLLTSAADYAEHKANNSNAHGIDGIKALAVAVNAEVIAARGVSTNLAARLAKALATDGSILLSSLQNKWLDNGDTPTFVDSQRFTVPTDRIKVYIAGAHVRLTISGSYAYAPIASSSYGGGMTTVILDPNYALLTSGLSKIEIGLLSFDYAIQNAVATNTAAIVALQSQLSLGIGGRLVKSVAGGVDVTLSNTELLNVFFELSGVITANINVIVSNSARGFFFYNNTTGAFTVTVKTAAGTGVVVANGARVMLECDGTNVVTPITMTIPALLTATSFNKVAITPPATGATITLQDGTTITFQGTDTYVGRATTDTLTNKRITNRVGSTASSATPAINTDNYDVYEITALAAAITGFTMTGTPYADDPLVIKITDNGTARAITWGSSFEASTVALPTTTVVSVMLTVGFMWNSVTSKWRCLGVV